MKTLILLLIILPQLLYSQNWSQLGQDIDGEAAIDQSGWSVSMNSTGDRVAIGATNNAINGLYSGHVRIYSYNGSNWTQLGQDIDGEAANDLSGWSISMNATGDRLAIGATGNDGTDINTGHVRIYEWNGSSWSQLGQDIDGEAGSDGSGWSVSMNSTGDRVAIGAPGNDDGGGANSSSGHVRIYSYNGSSWIQLGQDIDGALNDYQGRSVSMNAAGDRVAIGAVGIGPFPGRVRIYSYNGSSWTQLGQDIDGEAAGDQSSRSVSMNSTGDRVAIGANGNAGNGLNSGHVRIYSYNGSSWTQLGQDIDGEAASDQSGYSVSINSNGDRVAIGAYDNNGNGSSAGHVRIYEWNGSSWSQLGQDIDGEAASDWSGYSVSMNSTGELVAIGASGNDGNGTLAGHVRVFCQSTSGTDTQIACDSYLWIDGNTYNSSNNTATHSLTNTAGCDSVVTLALTINTVDSQVTQTGATLTADQTGAIYQWLDCDNGYAVISAETNQSYTPSNVTGNYAVEVTLNGCVDTSACYHVDYTGIDELTNTQKELIKIIDFMGRETQFNPNTPLIFIYSDGTRERVMEIEE